MTVTIAIVGRGEIGKPTLAGLRIDYLVQNNPGKVLAIDADPGGSCRSDLIMPRW